MRRRSGRWRLTTVSSLAGATLALGALAAPGVAKSSQALPAPAGKLSQCHKVLLKVAGRLPVTTDYAAQKGRHPARALLSCLNADAVALAGKRYYRQYPFGVGKKIKVGKVTYTMGVLHSASLGGKPVSGPVYGWAGGGVDIFLMNPGG